MVKSFTKFAGWLKFFYALFWINLVLGCLGVFAEFAARITDNPELAALADGFGLVESIIICIVCGLVIKSIKLRTPRARNLVHQLTISLIVAILLLALLKALMADGTFTDAFEYPHHILMPLLFSLYLTQSKRVSIYYQLPDEEKTVTQITREESTAVAHGMVKMFSISMLVIIGIMAFAGALIYVGQ